MGSEVRFEYSSVIDEIRSFMTVFSWFVDHAGERPEALWEQFQFAREHTPPNSNFELRIGSPLQADRNKRRAIRTITSRRAAEGVEWESVYAEYFMLLRLTQGPAKKGKTPLDFMVRSASSKCVIWKEQVDGDVEVATWNFDIGDIAGPGCRFHVQAHSQHIEIPRFLCPLILPNDCLAFLANELFPVSWPMKVAGSSEAKFHGPKQSARLAKLLSTWVGAMDRSVDPLRSIIEFRNYSPISGP